MELTDVWTLADRDVGSLSGGERQRAVVAMALAQEAPVLLLDEPTRGIDVGARREIYAILHRLAADGVAILFASSEMEEVLQLSDRTLVMYRGQIAGELSREELSEEAVMQLAVGGGDSEGGTIRSAGDLEGASR